MGEGGESGLMLSSRLDVTLVEDNSPSLVPTSRLFKPLDVEQTSTLSPVNYDWLIILEKSGIRGKRKRPEHSIGLIKKNENARPSRPEYLPR